VLAEHTFFILDLYGHLLVQRRLDHHPSCFWSYPANPTASSTDAAAANAKGGSVSSRGHAAAVQAENLLIATHTKALQVYRGQQLAWAAQLEQVPVAVRVTSIAGVRGMIVALDDSGEQCAQQHDFGVHSNAAVMVLCGGCMAVGGR
jgi:Bardet-Biedl syndrome 9 protein